MEKANVLVFSQFTEINIFMFWQEFLTLAFALVIFA